MKMKLKRIMIGTLIGAMAGVMLEAFNVSLDFHFAPPVSLFAMMTVLAILLAALTRSRKRDKESPLGQLPVAIAQYVDLVVKKMRYRRRIRDEVRRELATHFEDALAECKDENEKQELAVELIQEFGDGKMLATLIRRGKKRCRPLWKKTIIRSLQGVGVLILVFIAYTAWFMTGKPTISVDYVAKWNEMTRPQAAADENAWPHYEKAIALYVELDEETKEAIWPRKQRYSSLSPQRQTRLLAWLEDNRKHWDSLHPQLQAAIRKSLANGLAPVIIPNRRAAPEQKYRIVPFVSYHIIHQIPHDINPYMPYFSEESKPTMTDEDLGNQAELVRLLMKYEPGITEFNTAVAAAVLDDEISRKPQAPPGAFTELNPYEKRMLTRWLEDNENAWHEFVAGSLKGYCHRKYDSLGPDDSLLSLLMPHLSPLRALARVGMGRAELAAQEGRNSEVLDNCLTVIRAGKHWQIKEATLVEQLIGSSLSRMGCLNLLSTIARHDISPDDLQRIHQELSALHADGYPLMGIAGERLFFLDIVQRTFTEGGPGGGHILPRSLVLQGLAEPITWGNGPYLNQGMFLGGTLIHAGRDETTAMFNRLYGMNDKDMTMTPYELHACERKTVDEEIMDLPRHRFWLVRILMPALERAGALGFRGKAEYEATLTVLALMRWQLDKGQYPQELTELLATGDLRNLPDDPYGPGPLRYQRRADDFVLYSLGADFDDDGGLENSDQWGEGEEGGDRVFWPVQ